MSATRNSLLALSLATMLLRCGSSGPSLSLGATSSSPAGKLCGGQTERGGTAWEQYGTLGLSVLIDSRQCEFSAGLPTRYFSSVAGAETAWALTGTNSIYETKAHGFRVLVYHPAMRQRASLVYAQMHWTVGWIGIQGLTSGGTSPGLDWKQYGPHSLSIGELGVL